MLLTPEEKRIADAYNVHAEAWAREHPSADYWAKEMQEFKKLLPVGKVLEIGSGSGKDAAGLMAHGYEYVGTDASTRRTTFIPKSVYDLDFPAGTQFDGFWAAATLLRIPKKRIEQALAQIWKFMRAGAVGFISLKQGSGEEVRDRMEGGSVVKKFYSSYSTEEFRKILEANHFQVVRTTMRSDERKNNNWLCFFVRVRK